MLKLKAAAKRRRRCRCEHDISFKPHLNVLMESRSAFLLETRRAIKRISTQGANDPNAGRERCNFQQDANQKVSSAKIASYRDIEDDV